MNERSDPPERLPLQELVGTTLGEYTIRRVLGYGSMGVVFEAHHTKLDRRVALKALPPGLGSTEKAIQRFLREAQAVAQLSHEHIVPIYEISQSGAIHWYAMRFLDGEPLDKTLQRGRLDPQEAARLMQTAARAVHFAHQHGIIHRDIKPANMIVEHGGKLVLTDFGLARPEQGSGITDSGAMVGTPRYMSPEQIRAKRGEVDRRTDIWSLGATLYEMVAGEPPFPGESTQEILQQILDVEPRTPRSLRPDLPADLEVVILKAMEKEPKRRYASALELAQDLERFLEGEPIVARRSSSTACRHVARSAGGAEGEPSKRWSPATGTTRSSSTPLGISRASSPASAAPRRSAIGSAAMRTSARAPPAGSSVRTRASAGRSRNRRSIGEWPSMVVRSGSAKPRGA